jgi:hypothetical protein
MLWLFTGFKGCCGCSWDVLGFFMDDRWFFGFGWFFGYGWFFTDPGGFSDLDTLD